MKKVHKINNDDPNYDSYVRDPPVIPKCYTKKVDGKTVLLSDEELSIAKEAHGQEIEKQQEVLTKLKKLRNDIVESREKMKRIRTYIKLIKKVIVIFLYTNIAMY